MIDGARLVCRVRRAWPPRVRIAAALLATAGLAVAAAGCGSSPGNPVAQVGSTTRQSSSSSPASAQQSAAVAFARCMRSRGVANWPDPDSSGVFDKSKLGLQQLRVGRSQLQAAQAACQHLLPSGSAPNPTRLQQMKAQGLRFAQCVRSHGVPGFPDPDNTGRIPDPASVGVDQGSPKFQAANQACRKDRPPYIPSNPAYDSYAHGG